MTFRKTKQQAPSPTTWKWQSWVLILWLEITNPVLSPHCQVSWYIFAPPLAAGNWSNSQLHVLRQPWNLLSQMPLQAVHPLLAFGRLSAANEMHGLNSNSGPNLINLLRSDKFPKCYEPQVPDLEKGNDKLLPCTAVCQGVQDSLVYPNKYGK